MKIDFTPNTIQKLQLFSKFLTLVLTLSIHTFSYSQQFSNWNFENSALCDFNDCEQDAETCIDGWWHFSTPSSLGHMRWMVYDQCTYGTPCEGDINNKAALVMRGYDVSIGLATNNPLYIYTIHDLKGIVANGRIVLIK